MYIFRCKQKSRKKKEQENRSVEFVRTGFASGVCSVREGENKETEAAATDSSKNTDTCA